MDYIRINSVEEIDTHRISIRQINLRYIDRDGNRYATRFNLATRSIEIVRLASTREEALRLRREVIQDRRNRQLSELEDVLNEPDIRGGNGEWPVTLFGATDPGSSVGEDPASTFVPDAHETESFPENSAGKDRNSFSAREGFSFENTTENPEKEAGPSSSYYSLQGAVPVKHPFEEGDHGYNPYTDDFHFDEAHNFHGPESVKDEVFYESSFIEETIQELQKVRDRQFAIINNLKKTGYFDSHSSADFSDITRAFDVECWQPTEKTINYHKELFTFPRPVNHYISKLNDARKSKIEAIEEPEKRMEQIRRWEMQDSFEAAYDKIETVTAKMLSLVKQIPEADLKALTGIHQTFFKDAQTLCSILVEEAGTRLRKIQQWRKRYP